MKVLMTFVLLFLSFATPSLAIGAVGMVAPKGGGGGHEPVSIFPEALAPDIPLLQPEGGTFWKDAKNFYSDHGYRPTARQQDLLANPWLWVRLIHVNGGSYTLPRQVDFQTWCERTVPAAPAEMALQAGECAGLAKMVTAKFASELDYLSWRTERRTMALVVLFACVFGAFIYVTTFSETAKRKMREEFMDCPY